MTRRRRTYAFLLALILILSAILRFVGLDDESLWGDEITTVLLARMSPVDLIRTNIVWENIPPLHHVILLAWGRVFGDSEFSVRTPSVIFGVGGVWMTAVLVRRLLGPRVALVAALLLAVNPMHIEYSQECRSYTLSVFLGLLATDAFVRLLRRPTQRLHVLYILAAALGLYAHLYGLFTILVHHLIYWPRLLRSKRPMRLRPKAWLLDNIAAAALFSPWAPIVYRWTRSVAKNFWVKEVTLGDIARSYYTFAGSRTVLFIMTALIVIAIAATRRSRRRARFGMTVLLAIMLVPIVVPVVMSVLTTPTFAPRYGIIATVSMCALSAIGILALPRWLGVPTVLALCILSPLGRAPDIYRENWRVAADFLNKYMRPGDLAVVHARGGTRLYDYYVHRPDVPRRGTDAGTIPVSLPLDGRRVWLLHHAPWYPLNSFLNRGPLYIERRLVTEGIIVVELTDERRESVDGGSLMMGAKATSSPSTIHHQPSMSSAPTSPPPSAAIPPRSPSP